MIRIHPGPVAGAVDAPGSKSHTHRAFLLAAQGDAPATVTGALLSDDTNATLACLHRLGARAHPDAGPGTRPRATVRFDPAALRPAATALDCRNSGTTLRLLCATAARLPARSILDGDASLRSRPNAHVLAALRSLGATCEGRGSDGMAPIAVQGPIRPGAATLPAGTSSQFASALLLSLPMLPGPSTLTLEAPVASAPYIEVTLAAARRAGLRIEDRPSAANGRTGFAIAGGDRPRLSHEAVEGDWSSAAFILVAAAITGGTAAVRGLAGDSLQGDRAVVELLRSFGASCSVAGGEARCTGTSLASPGTVDVSQHPDLFPAMAVAASVARGTTTFTGGAALRRKETDRIAAMARGLAAMGIACRELPDGLAVTGGRLRGATVACGGDHRIHMAFAVAALAADGPTTLDGEATAAVSYPGFHDALRALGARVEAA